MNKEICEVECINEKAVREVKSKMPDNKLLLKMADKFKILSDLTRIKILYALSVRELCVCDMASLLNMTQSAISHQLRILRSAGVVNFRKEGKIVYYFISDNRIIKLIKIKE